MMIRRTILASLAALAVGLVTSATALAFHHGGSRHGVMKRVAAAMIDEALDRAQATPEQRMAIHAARDRVFAALEEHHRTRAARLDEALALFEADHVDAARLAALRAEREAAHRRLGDAIEQAIIEMHDVLTPTQRRAVTDWIRARRW
ncbi:MAG TPA: periplasmic heavy metal sensor [Candidatus Tectomicrobia bacterium]|nr:periplasmic heavy metal sensor [Candidatus Tectomicrobia bacterium]